MPQKPPRLARFFATFLMRGKDAEFILSDLDEGFDRDVARGQALTRARLRYVVNAVRSICVTWADAIGRSDVGVSMLDAKLGFRMMRKSPGLTVVSIATLGIGIPLSLIPLQSVRMVRSDLPFEEADRIVAIQNRDLTTSRRDLGLIHDLELWRESLTSIELVSAALVGEYNVGSESQTASPVRGVEVTASAFAVTRVAPLMGRTLLPEDEAPGAEAVVVVSHDVWQGRFGGDEEIVGSTVSIGGEPHTVVGVMPRGFLFPMFEHVWLPFRENSLDYERGSGPQILVFGRLAPGLDLEGAQVELKTLGERMSSDWAESHGLLRPEVGPFVEMVVGDMEIRDFYLAQLLTFLLLAVACGSVGNLFFARTASRAGELSIRTALGASRRRVVGQLFVEAVLIALVAMALGLALADQVSPLVVAKIESELGQSFPFWIDFGVNPHLVLPALPVAVVAAVLAGVVPALKLTGKGVLTGLKRSGSGASVRFGKAATLLVIVQIALAVGLLSVAVGARVGVKSAARDHRGLGIDPDRYLYASLAVPLRIPTSKELRGGDYSQAARVRAQEVWTELDARLSVEPGVRGVAWGTNLPAESHPSVSIEVQGNSADRDGRTHRIRRAVVDVEFFRGLGAPILRGRGFDVSDAEGGSRFVIVNSNFVRRVLGGAEPIGQRFRYLRREGDEPAPWFEIVGVVGSLGVDVHEPGADEAVYHPMKPGYAVKVAVELSGDPTLFASRLRELTAEVAPTVLLRRTQPLTDVLHKAFADARIGGLTAGLVAMISTLLSAAGLFAIVSFTVAQRTRELGIRSALGATSVRILTTVFQRAFLQTSAGILGGIVFAGAFVSVVFAEVEKDGVNWLATVGGVVVFMLLVVLAACLRPALRGLRIQPTEALREG